MSLASTPTPHKPHPLTVSTASSIVVQYRPRSSSPTPITPPPITVIAERKRSTTARKVSPSELSGSDDDDDEMEEEEEEAVTNLPKPTLDYLKRSESIGSMTSMYSASCGKGNYDITGEILVGVWYKNDQLYVRVTKAKGLAGAKKSGTSDPYVKSYLLPDRSKKSKRKTGIVRKTTSPVYNELLKV